MDDAAMCVSKGPNFIKGYYRLATALTELGMYDDAINTLNMAMSKEPGAALIVLLSYTYCVCNFLAVVPSDFRERAAPKTAEDRSNQEGSGRGEGQAPPEGS